MSPLSVRGGLLSCFTASIASYMAHCGIDYELAIGAQLFTAVRIDPAPGSQPVFTHYHTPLLGDHLTHALHLTRRRTSDRDEAVSRIITECERSGAVIVAGDAFHLPWLITRGKRHAPHWFLVDAVNNAGRTFRVTDRFEFLDEQGEQRAFSGWLTVAELPGITRAYSEPNPVLEHRDRWAFGEEFDPAQSVLDGCQWFEAAAPPAALSVTPAQCLGLMQSTRAAHGRSLRPAHLSDPAWICGLDALQWLADYCAAHLDDPGLYQLSDDLWVAARCRQLFALTLRRLGGELNRDSLDQIGAFCETEIAPQWLALPRVMRYNASCLERGRPPRALLVDILQKIAESEETLMSRLGTAIA